jgi:uncharacterized membrane protein YfcA
MLLGLLMLAVAFLSSILNGLASVGGGVMFVIILILMSPSIGYEDAQMQFIASMAMFLSGASALTGAIFYYRKNLYNKNITKYMSTAALIGGFTGSLLANYINNQSLQFVFFIITILSAVSMFLDKTKKVMVKKELPMIWSVFISFFIGILGGIFGIGLAFFTLPVMVILFKISIKQAVGSTLFVSFFITFGAILGKLGTPYINWELSSYIMVGSIFGALLGGIISVRLKSVVLQNVIAILMVGLAMKQILDLLL